MVQAQSNVRAPSVELTAFNAMGSGAHLEGDDDDGFGELFMPGTFVEVRRNDLTSHAVVLGQELKETRWHVIVINASGELWDPLRDDIMFSIPGLVTPDLARRCTTVPVAGAEDEIALRARIKVLQHIRQVETAVEAATTEIIRKNMKIYSWVKSKNADEWATTTVAQVARLFSDKPSLVDTFAVHKYLMNNSLFYVANHSYRVSDSFDVRPESHLAIIKKVTNWSRDPAGPISAFVQRALPIIEANRQIHSETQNDVPSQRPAQHKWSPNDIVILTFLRHALRPVRSTQKDPYSLGTSAIMRQLEPDRMVADHRVHMALIDLGVFAPWQDIFSLRRNLNLDQEDPKTSPKAQALDALVQRSLSAPAPSGPLGPEDLYPSDPVDHLRHDFGDMPIYVVDDAHAQELDDGFSVEPVAGEPGSHWVHVHIADPTSTIPPTHILAQRAEKQSQSSYFIHRSWPLFPQSLMFSGRPGFSLSQNENRVLTFSSKVNAAGEVVDHLVRPGIARNFVTMSYDQVDLAISGALMPRSYPFSPPPALPSMVKLSDSQLADLRMMDAVRARLINYRFRLGVIDACNDRAEIRRFVTPQNIESPTMRPTEFRGFPEFTYFTSNAASFAVGARGMVAEAMKVACRTASRWCAERGVEVPRRTASPLQAPSEAMQKLLALRDEGCYVDVGAVTALATTMPIANYSLHPGAHWSMAAPEGEGYTRATSPLRRFSDLIVHYQIQRHLLGEKPYFDAAYLEDYMQWLAADDRLKRRSETLHLRSWVLIALRRWMAAPRTDVPDPLADLHAVVLKAPRNNSVRNETESEVHIPALGIGGALLGDSRFSDWNISASLPVKVHDISLGTRPRLELRIR
ncbi:hypothetical protein B0H15DRAFT_789921 [Mycena belliarum]|uniref:RNB domain-containing protein n=1 Tax=Mycena belliarum TaxID=1033014 RepID=A0AAD6TUX9_9AGAR|nr:hypothetical protein B0H15DRAFT_789921 [Mycena belliae]